MATERSPLLRTSSSSLSIGTDLQRATRDYSYGHDTIHESSPSDSSSATSSGTIRGESPRTPTKALDASPGLAITKGKDYDRFTSGEKKFIVAMCACCGLLPFFVSGTFYPSVPAVAKDFDTTPAVVGIAISVSIFSAALGGLTGAAYSSAYGRRPIYLTGLLILFFGSVGVATSQSIGPLLFWRFFQAYGGAPGISVGAGVIGDIYRLEERGTAMGIFFAASLVGAAIGPPIGGFVAHYSSWRFMQLSLGLWGLLGFSIIYAWFPETLLPQHRCGAVHKKDEDASGDAPQESSIKRTVKDILSFLQRGNPFSAVGVLRSPVMLFITITGFSVLLTDFVLLVPLAYTIAPKYGIHTTAAVGACYLPIGFGNMVGAPIAGRVSDYIVVRCRRKRGGLWYPEDRIRVSIFSAFTLVPLSILGSGLATHFIDGTVGLVLNLVCLFVNGIGVTMTLSTLSAYIVDVLHNRSAESVAVSAYLLSFGAVNARLMVFCSSFRAAAVAMTVSGIIPMVETYGVAITDGCAAVFTWFGGFLLLITFMYGERLRNWVDIGYSKSTDGN